MLPDKEMMVGSDEAKVGERAGGDGEVCEVYSKHLTWIPDMGL